MQIPRFTRDRALVARRRDRRAPRACRPAPPCAWELRAASLRATARSGAWSFQGASLGPSGDDLPSASPRPFAGVLGRPGARLQPITFLKYPRGSARSAPGADSPRSRPGRLSMPDLPTSRLASLRFVWARSARRLQGPPPAPAGSGLESSGIEYAGIRASRADRRLF